MQYKSKINNNQHIADLNSYKGELAVINFYNPQDSRQLQLSRNESLNNPLINMVRETVQQFKNAIIEVLWQTQQTLLIRDYLSNDSKLFRQSMEQAAELIVQAGQQPIFFQHLMKYYSKGKNMNAFKDQDLVVFYNALLQRTQLTDKNNEEMGQNCQHCKEMTQNKQTQCSNSNSQGFNQSQEINQFTNNQIYSSQMMQYNDESDKCSQMTQFPSVEFPQSNLPISYQFLMQFSDDIFKISQSALAERGGKIVVKQIVTSDTEHSSNFEYYDSLQNTLFRYKFMPKTQNYQQSNNLYTTNTASNSLMATSSSNDNGCPPTKNSFRLNQRNSQY